MLPTLPWPAIGARVTLPGIDRRDVLRAIHTLDAERREISKVKAL